MAGIRILAARQDQQWADAAANGLSNCLTRDGQGSAQANLPMNSFRHTMVGNAAALTDYAAAGQVQTGLLSFAIAAGTSDAITAVYSPAIAGLVDGMQLGFRATATNTTSAPTFSPSGFTAHPIVKSGGLPLLASDILDGQECVVRYNLANTRWELLNPSDSGATATYNLKSFGAVGDGSTNDYPAIVLAFAALTAAGGGVLTVPSGTYAIASATSSSIVVPNNVIIQGVGAELSVFKVTGSSTLNALFIATNPSNIWFRDLGLYGNSQASSSGSAGAIEFTASSPSGVMENFGCENVTLWNFKQTYWIYAINPSSTAMKTGRFENVRAFSLNGNMRAPNDINEPSAVLAFIGQTVNLGGTISDIVVDKGYCDGTWIKSYSVFWSGVSNSSQINSTIENCGANTANNSGGYGTFAYLLDPGSIGATAPTAITWTGNKIVSAKSNGIYCATVQDCMISGNYIYGQTDTSTGVPDVKAGIGGAGMMNCVISGNVLIDNFNGIEMGGVGNTVNIISDNIIQSSVSGGAGIWIKSVGGAATSATRTILNNNSITVTGATSAGVIVYSATGSGLNPGYVKISGGRIEAAGVGIQSFDTGGGGAVCTGIEIGSVTLAGNPSPAIQHTGTATPIIIHNVTVDASNFDANDNGVVLTNATVVDIDDLLLENKASGAGVLISLAGTLGTMANVSFRNVGASQRYTAPDFGTVKPTNAVSLGAFVQNLNPVEAGSGGSKYIVTGWTNTSGSTTWNDNRTLTGN